MAERERPASAAQDAGDLLRAARRLADLSQRQLAERSGVAPSVVARIESGQTAAPRMSTLLVLLASAGFRLRLEADLPRDTDVRPLTDRAGRRFPAHLDVRDVDAFGSWWGDWPMLSTRAERIWPSAPRPRPAHTFDLARWRRDARRAAAGPQSGDYARPHPAE